MSNFCFLTPSGGWEGTPRHVDHVPGGVCVLLGLGDIVNELQLFHACDHHDYQF